MTAKKPVWQNLPLFDTSGMDSAHEQKARRLEEWWMANANAEAHKAIAKAIEYGSADLDIMGEAMLVLMPQMKGVVPPQELAIAFYCLGKVARLFGAYAEGRAPSDDTWEDMTIYPKMAQRVRETGQWG